jgi:hypothetical protein
VTFGVFVTSMSQVSPVTVAFAVAVAVWNRPYRRGPPGPSR